MGTAAAGCARGYEEDEDDVVVGLLLLRGSDDDAGAAVSEDVEGPVGGTGTPDRAFSGALLYRGMPDISCKSNELLRYKKISIRFLVDTRVLFLGYISAGSEVWM